ncbi:MAG TPA: Ig-like domain-containing protein [Clostridia bacterium]|nr:Ig-like domain-containing protein [Clostridia bacterium]
MIVSSPASGSTVSSPVHFVASATSTSTVTAMRIYVDNNSVYLTNSARIDTKIALSNGTHSVTVQAWDKAGRVQKSSRTISVRSSTSNYTGGSPEPGSGAKVFSKIEQMSGWQWCDRCAGPGGNGTTASYWMKRGISSPSMDGSSTQFFLGGTNPYAAALWWKQLGGNASVKNFVYDMYFYIKNPGAAQALEFDVNQAQNGKRFIFGTQCDYKDHKTWDVFDGVARKWISTGIPCSAPQAYTWNHVVFEFQRTSDNRAKFVSVTLNGKKNYINRSYAAHSSGSYELNVAFQMDGNKDMTDYSVWLDQVKLTVW